MRADNSSHLDMRGAALIVEDDAHIRELLASLLRQFGFQHVVETSGAHDALHLVTLRLFSVALIDLALAGEDGVELIGAIRAHQRSHVQNLPIVVVSRCTKEDRVRCALKAGADGFVAKPLTIAHLQRQIANAMAGRSKQQPQVLRRVGQNGAAAPGESFLELD